MNNPRSRLRTIVTAASAAVLCTASVTHAALRVFTCEPEWAALTTELGGDRVVAESATTPLQDVHFIQARPSLIAKVRRANLVVCTGAQLEIGWLPVLLRQGGNPAVQPGNPGYFEAAHFVRMLEVRAQVDRAEGDIHPFGNPHLQTDPHNIAVVARALAERLGAVDPANQDFYTQRYADFAKRWQAAIAGWELRAAPLRGLQIVTHHQAWAYTAHWLDLRDVAHLEPKPGVPPTATSLAALLTTLQTHKVRAIVRAAFEDEQASAWLAQRIGAPAVVLPHTVGSTPGAKDLYGLFDDTIDRLLAAAQHH